METNKKKTSLQALRAIAFFGVFLHHSDVGIKCGAWGVSIFLVLSGFLMVYSHVPNYDGLHHTWKERLQFAWKHISKLYLLYVISCLLYVILMLFKGGVRNIWMYGVIDLFLLQSWIPDQSVYFSLNGVAWFFSVCAFLYFMFWVILEKLYVIKSSKKIVRVLGLLMLVQLALSFVCFSYRTMLGELVRWLTYICPFVRIIEFMGGMLIGFLFYYRNSVISKSTFLCLEIICAIMNLLVNYIYINGIYPFGEGGFKYNFLFFGCSLLTVWLFAENKGKLFCLFDNPIFVFIGNMSPYAFLLHPIVIIYWQHLVDTFNLSLSVIECTIIEFFITSLCCWLWEKVYRWIRMAFVN